MLTQNEFWVEVCPHPQHNVVVIRGEVDVATAGRLDATLAALPPDHSLAFDLSGVDFMDSTGLTVLVLQIRRMSDAGGVLWIARASEPVRRLLHIAGLEDLLDLRG